MFRSGIFLYEHLNGYYTEEDESSDTEDYAAIFDLKRLFQMVAVTQECVL